jgi:hypothetical protein
MNEQSDVVKLGVEQVCHRWSLASDQPAPRRRATSRPSSAVFLPRLIASIVPQSQFPFVKKARSSEVSSRLMRRSAFGLSRRP